MTSSFEVSHPDAAAEEVFVFPAAFAQQRLWFLHQLAPDNPFYNVAAAVRLSGRLNLPALDRTFSEIRRRHESLRTTFSLIEGELMQVIAPAQPLIVPVVDLRSLPADDREADAAQRAIETARDRFNLTQGPLLRVRLLQLHESEFILLLILHHLIADGWSMGVLLREVGVLYTAFDQGLPSPLPELSIQYADFAHWQRQWLQGEILQTQLAYWQQQLQDLPLLDLPTDYPRPAVQRYRGATQPIALSPTLTSRLESLSQTAGVSLFMTLLAAFQLLLHRYSGQTDIVVGTPIANRTRQSLEAVIGFFVNSLVLRLDLSGNPSFRELLDRVRPMTLAAYAHQDLPFEKVVQLVQPQRQLSRQPLFQVAIALQNTPIQALQLPGLQLHPYPIELGTTRLDLELHLWPTAAGLQGQLTYSTDLFAAATIARLIGHLQTLLSGIVEQPDLPIADLPLLTAAERQQWLQDCPRSLLPLEPLQLDVCIHHRFEAQAERTPAAIAVVCGGRQLSYRELNDRSNQLAEDLRQRGAGAEVLVGVCLERSIEMVVAVLAILKAGAAYVPIDPSYPPSRCTYILDDTRMPILVTQPSLISRFGESVTRPELQTLCLDRDSWAIAPQPAANPSRCTPATALAYVIYTSGSSGQPKGVLIEHGGLANLAEAQQMFNVQSGDRVLQFASLSFDASVFELVMALQAGAALYLLPAPLTGAPLTQFLRQHQITVATLPPTVLAGLDPEQLPALRTLISAGEACPPALASRWATANRRCFNAYGPTEATVWTTIAELHPNTLPRIGRAIAKVQVYVLDGNRQPVPIGVPGELYIGGRGVARGYLNRPDLTTERFIANPFADPAHTDRLHNRLYKSGDRVRCCADGMLEFLGRCDQQVKLRGHRIELGEIEATLMQHPAIRAAAVAVCQRGNPQLAAYLVADSRSLSTAEVRQYLQARLPAYLVPASFEQLASLPLTANGKIDRASLCQRRPVRSASPGRQAATPTETLLTGIWQQVLGLELIHPDDNFFELGGDLLLAMQLIEQVKQQCGHSLPLATLFQAPTIAQLAAQVEQTAVPAAASSCLVPLKRSGAKAPFFCVHPIFGVVLPYCELAQALDPDQPFYGLQSPGLDGTPPLDRIEDMAARYIEAIRSVQPEGPYLLGGWSFGGLVAFEMAQQLQQAGQAIGILAVFDTAAPLPGSLPSLSDSLKFLLTTAARSTLPLLLDYGSLLLAGGVRWGAIANRVPEVSRLRLLNELAVLPLLRIFYRNNQSVHRYTAKRYPGKITLFRVSQSAGDSQLGDKLGWERLAAQVEVHPAAGNHLSMLKSPQVLTLAAQLQQCLNQIGL